MNNLFKRWLVGALAVATLIFMFAPAPQRKVMADAKFADGWLVPRLAPKAASDQSAVSGLLKSKMWGGSAELPAAPDEKASRWRIAGITGKSTERYAVVQFGDDRIQQLKMGDKLPDGSLISEVRERGICILIEGKKRSLPLDGQAVAIVW